MIKKVTNFILNKLQREKLLLFRTNEEGSTIRKTRLRKFRTKSKKLIIAAQIVAIWYLLIISGSYLTTNTGAYFNDVEVIEEFIGAADDFYEDQEEEWDRSSLSFTSIGGFCSQEKPGIIFSEIMNGGDKDMAGTTKYYLYRVELSDGGPNQNNLGELVTSGEVQALPGKDSTQNKAIISFQPNLNEIKPGKYKYKADQRPNHSNPNNDPDKDTQHETWGTEITITQEDINNCKVLVGIDSLKDPIPPTETNPNEDTNPPSEIDKDKLKHTQKNKNFLKLTWNKPSDPDFSHFNIYRDGILLENGKNITTLEFEDTVNPSTKYLYLIKTVDTSENESVGVSYEVTTNDK